MQVGKRHDFSANRDFICVDLFAGCGGLSLGASRAGLSTSHAVEFEPNAARTFQLNFPECRVITRDIRQVSAADLSSARFPDIVLAGPPCAPFSTSNQRTRGPRHPSNHLYSEALRLISDLRPEAVLFENVEGFGEGRAQVYKDDLADRLSRLGYHVTASVASAADAGVPQNRRRLFIVGTRFPFSLNNEMIKFAPVTVADAIHDLPSLPLGASEDVVDYRCPPTSEYAKSMRGGTARCSGHLVTNNSPAIASRYAHIPPGGNWRNIPIELLNSYADVSRCHSGIYHRLHPHKPSRVIGNFRKNMLIHPYENRGLSVREAARLQSFPDSFRFAGSIGKQQQQVGNAVPPLLAERVIKQLSTAMRAAK